MKKPMKLLRNLLLGTFTMALWFGVNSQTVKAEADTSILPHEITIDYEHQQLIISETSARDAEIICEFGTRRTVTTGRGSSRESRDVCSFYSSDTYDYHYGMMIDLSFLKREKDNYIRLYGNYSEYPITIKIPAVNTAVKAKFDPVNGIVKMYDYTDKSDVTQFTTEPIEYRNAYGNWQEYIYVADSYDAYGDLSMYQQRGATLYFRLKAEAAQRLQVVAPNPTYNDVEDVDGEDIPVYETSSFPGKEVKVAIPQLPSAPKVSVDYSRQRVVLPKGTQYRMVAAGNNNDMQWVSAKKATSLQLELEDLTERFGKKDNSTLEVRYAKTEKNPASKVNRIRIAMGSAPTVHSIKAASVSISKQSIDNSCLHDELGSDALVAQYVYNARRKVCTGVRFMNDLEEAYEICAVRGGGTPTPSCAGVQTIKAWTEKTNGSAVTTIPISRLKDGSKVFIRRKADLKSKQFSSPWTAFGVVAYPEEDPEY